MKTDVYPNIKNSNYVSKKNESSIKYMTLVVRQPIVEFCIIYDQIVK